MIITVDLQLAPTISHLFHLKSNVQGVGWTDLRAADKDTWPTSVWASPHASAPTVLPPECVHTLLQSCKHRGSVHTASSSRTPSPTAFAERTSASLCRNTYFVTNRRNNFFAWGLFLLLLFSPHKMKQAGEKAVSVYLSVNYRCFSTWSHVNNAAAAKSRVSLLVTVMGHLGETFYFIYGCGKGYDGLAWGDQRTNPWILCSPAFTWVLEIEFRLPCVPSHLTGPERNTSKEKGLDLACRRWLAVYTVSRSLVRQNMVVDGYGSKAA